MRLNVIEHPNVVFDLRYASSNNIAGAPIYSRAVALLHPEADAALTRSADLASSMGYRLCIFDAYRPTSAQRSLWKVLPNPIFVADPAVGSTHTRGIAVDLTLMDGRGVPLDMGTDFDVMSELSGHACVVLPAEVQRNRALLLGLMTAAGWIHQPSEWWHYNLPNEFEYPLIDDEDVVSKIM